MARLFYVHWHRQEALDTVRTLRDAGHSVRYHADSGEGAWRLLTESAPEVLVVSLARLPSHGRRLAAIARQRKALRDVPVVFVGGEPDKVRAAQREFPGACFCAADELEGVLAGVGAGGSGT